MSRGLKITGILLLVSAGIYTLFFREEQWPVVNVSGSGAAIVAFGDSITSGVGAPPGRAYPDQLAAIIGTNIINAGVPGDTSQSALRRVQRDVIPHAPRIVIIAVGGNDALQRVSAQETMRNVREIITVVQKAGAMVLLVGVDPPLSQVNYGEKFKALARETGCAYVPNILSGWFLKPKLMADQIHPNEGGAKVIAERIAPVLRRYLDGGP